MVILVMIQTLCTRIGSFLCRYTLSALQILAICDKLEQIDKEKVASFIMGLYQPNGSFTNDRYGELDLRFNYCAVQSMCLIGKREQLDIFVVVRTLMEDLDPFQEAKVIQEWCSVPLVRCQFFIL